MEGLLIYLIKNSKLRYWLVDEIKKNQLLAD